MELELSDVKPSVLSLLTVGVMAVVFILLGKYLTAKMNVPYLKELFGAL